MHPDADYLASLSPDQREVVVASLCEKRSRLVPANERATDDRGRIVAFYPDKSLNDGLMSWQLSHYEHPYARSGGFTYIDENDDPPWDTWFCHQFYRDHSGENVSRVLCWIPDPILKIVQAAMDADACDCLKWV